MLKQSDPLDFPYSDDEPMTDRDINRLNMEYTEQALQDYFQSDPRVYISANLFIYCDEHDANDRISPDVFWVRGVANHLRDHYKLWLEKIFPPVVFEFVSKSSAQQDLTTKLERYARLGVREYYVFDATGQFMAPTLRCFHRVGDRLVEVPTGTVYHSPELGLDLQMQGVLLRFFVPGLAAPLPVHPEMVNQLRLAEQRAEADRQAAAALALSLTQRADHEAALRQAAEGRNRELMAEIERLRARDA